LTAQQYARLLRMPDRRSTAATAISRCCTCSALLACGAPKRASDGRLPRAIPRSTSWWVAVHYGKRGRCRAVPLVQDALDAIDAWVRARPTCVHERTARLATENRAGAAMS
jgi:hypothetical protein